MIVFRGRGVGMAAPYLILSARPSLLNFVPRTGPASNLVKQVMGLFLLAAAAFFVAGGISGLIADKPYLSHTINWWVVAFFVTVASLWLIVRTLQISRAVWPRVVMPLFAAVFMAAAILFAGVQTGTARESYLRQQEALAEGGGGGDDGLVAGAWLPYTPERVAKARAADNVVLVDFTANWCIICKSWKARYLDTDPVRARLRELNAILIEADTTSKNSAASKYLQELGQTGVPTIAVFGPALKEPIIFNAYTSETVMNALNAAAGEKGTALRGP
jgi:thiol:disulfide interchange protein